MELTFISIQVNVVILRTCRLFITLQFISFTDYEYFTSFHFLKLNKT